MKPKNITILTSIGSGLEYYDFVIFAMLAGYLSRNFFPETSHYAGLMATFTVFAVGYFVRPLGGVLFGTLGDRFGRKYTFLFSILLMSISTLLIGLVPSYSSIGIYAAIIFTLLRILQGISIGAELPGALTFLVEHVGEKHRGTHGGFMVFGVSLGAALGSLVVYAITQLMPGNEILEWGWRIPFLAGSIIGFVIFFIRRYTTETPFFKEEKEPPKWALIDLLKGHYKELILGIGIVLFPGCKIIFFLCMPSFLHDVYGYSVSSICFLMILGYILSAVLIPFYGWISDYITRRVLLIISAFVSLIFVLLFFEILFYREYFILVVFILFYQVLTAALAVSYFTMLPEGFPTSVRYTGVAFCYNIAYSIAGLMPVAANFILETTDNKAGYIALLLAIIALITITSAVMTRNYTRCKLR